MTLARSYGIRQEHLKMRDFLGVFHPELSAAQVHELVNDVKDRENGY